MLAAAVVAGCGGSGGDSETTSTAAVSPASGQHRGGELVMLSKAAADTGDPQVNYSIQFTQLFAVTFDGLVAFAKTGDGVGERIVPDVATEVPKPTDGGKTWKFTIRRGIRFSTGEELTPKDVKASFERIFKVKGPTAGTFYGAIDGADQCLRKPSQCSLDRGIEVDPKAWTVTFHLTRPDSEFLQRLAVWFASVLPADAPAKDIGTSVRRLPSTGPYVWKQYEPTKQVVLERNPHFKQWSAEAQPEGFVDRIVVKYGLQPSDQVTAVANGQGDYTFDPIPSDRLNEISTKYAEQVHVNQASAVWYWSLNTLIPPFDNVKARQAVNYAFDRNSAVLAYGGPRLARPTCQILPPGYPGYVRYCPYAKADGGPDLEKARQLVEESGTKGAAIDVVPSNIPMQERMGEYMATLLRQLGYRPRLKALDDGIQYSFVQNTKNKVGAALELWSQDYTAPSDFLDVLLSCGAFHPNSDASPNIGGFCDKGIDAQMREAEQLQLAGKVDEANAVWARVDRAMTDQAPWVSLFTPNNVDFVSTRLGGYNWSATFLMLPSRVWVR